MSKDELLALAERRDANGRLKAIPLELRFWAKVERRGPNECWPWKGFVSSNGYGQIGVAAGRIRGAHRIAYELAAGPIPDGMQLDHTCRNRRCVNPAHLEPVTPGENTRRGNAGLHRRVEAAAITNCPAGHPYTEENTYVSKQGKRSCRACKRIRDDLRRNLRKAP